MKAIILDGIGEGSLRLVDRPRPEPRAHEVVVRMLAASLNYRDVEIIRGTFHTAFPMPLVPLSDGVGEVVAIGEGVSRLGVGDRVCGAFWPRWTAGGFDMADTSQVMGGPLDGMLTEYVRLEAQGVVRVPTHLTHTEAATLPCAGVTAFHALISEGGLKAGDTVLIQGTGGVSVFALQFAVAAGARVIVTSSSDAKLERAKTLGASAGVNYRNQPAWAAAVLDLTGGRGVDHVLEVGGPSTFVQSLKAVRVGGQISVIGYLGGLGGQIDPLDIFRRKLVVRGIPVGSRASFEAMNRALEVGGIRPVVDRVFPWRQAADAVTYFAGGTHFGKVALSFAD